MPVSKKCQSAPQCHRPLLPLDAKISLSAVKNKNLNWAHYPFKTEFFCNEDRSFTWRTWSRCSSCCSLQWIQNGSPMQLMQYRLHSPGTPKSPWTGHGLKNIVSSNLSNHGIAIIVMGKKECVCKSSNDRKLLV